MTKLAYLMLGLVLALVSCTKSVTTANARGGDVVGNGGGGICFADHCSTLAEAGLRVSVPDEPNFVLAPPMVQALNDLATRIPLAENRKDFIKQTIGNGSNFIKLDVADPAKIEAIRRQYADVLRENNSQIDPKDVRVFAFARVVPLVEGVVEYRDETYLLPDFFLLSPDQQAKVLVHERNVRGFAHHEHFKDALELDGYIEDFSANPKKLFDKGFRIERWVELLAKFYDITDHHSQILANWMVWFQQNGVEVFDAEKFCNFEIHSCAPNISQITGNYQVTPRFVRYLTNHNDPMYYHQLSLDGGRKDYESAIKMFCMKNLHLPSTEAWLFFPFNFYGPDYHLTLVNCKYSEDTYTQDAYLFETDTN